MNSNCQTIKFLNHDLDHQDRSQVVSRHGWTRVPALLRSQTTLLVLAILVTLGLMLTFHQVVLGAVAQGESLQQARNLQSAAVWRCNGLRGSTERENCLSQVHPNGSIGASL